MDKMANANKKNGDRWNICIVYEKQKKYTSVTSPSPA